MEPTASAQGQSTDHRYAAPDTHRICQPPDRFFLQSIPLQDLWRGGNGDLSADLSRDGVVLFSHRRRDPDRHLKICGFRNKHQGLPYLTAYPAHGSSPLPAAVHPLHLYYLPFCRFYFHSFPDGKKDGPSASHLFLLDSAQCHSLPCKRLFLRHQENVAPCRHADRGAGCQSRKRIPVMPPHHPAGTDTGDRLRGGRTCPRRSLCRPSVPLCHLCALLKAGGHLSGLPVACPL